jgi:hypothetical protein
MVRGKFFFGYITCVAVNAFHHSSPWEWWWELLVTFPFFLVCQALAEKYSR